MVGISGESLSLFSPEPESATRLVASRRAPAPSRVTLPLQATGRLRSRARLDFPTPSAEAVAKRRHLAAGPLTFGECATWEGPCRLTACRWNSASFRSGHLDATPGNCLLRLASEGSQTLEEIADAVGCTRERIRQIEERALRNKTVRAGLARFQADSQEA